MAEFIGELIDGTLGGLKMVVDVFVLVGIVVGGGGWCGGRCGGVIMGCSGWRDGRKKGGWNGWMIWCE